MLSNALDWLRLLSFFVFYYKRGKDIELMARNIFASPYSWMQTSSKRIDGMNGSYWIRFCLSRRYTQGQWIRSIASVFEEVKVSIEQKEPKVRPSGLLWFWFCRPFHLGFLLSSNPLAPLQSLPMNILLNYPDGWEVRTKAQLKSFFGGA